MKDLLNDSIEPYLGFGDTFGHPSEGFKSMSKKKKKTLRKHLMYVIYNKKINSYLGVWSVKCKKSYF